MTCTPTNNCGTSKYSIPKVSEIVLIHFNGSEGIMFFNTKVYYGCVLGALL